jgi:hypothetical protein
MALIRRIALASVFLLLAACSSVQPYSASSPARMDFTSTCACATTALQKYGYTVVGGNEAAGVFTAERHQSEISVDRLRVSVAPDSAGMLTVSAAGTSAAGKEPGRTYAVKWDIRKLLDKCAEQSLDRHSSASGYRVSERP